MNKRELLGHCFCDMRFNELLQLIETAPLAKVLEIQTVHKQAPKNFRYQDLELALNKRLQ